MSSTILSEMSTIFRKAEREMKFNENTLCDRQNKPIIKCFHSTVPAGKRVYTEHHHTECELSLFLSGSGRYSVGKKSYDFQSGDVFLFSSDEIHCITDIYSVSPFNLLNIHFEPRILWSNPDMSDISLLKLFFDRNENFQNRIDRSNPARNTIAGLITEIEKELEQKKSNYGLMAKMNLNRVLITLLREFDYVKEGDCYNSYTNSVNQLERAMNYIDNNLASPLTLESLSRFASVTPTYFSTMFKKFNGISPWEYITIKRVEKAVQLIKTTSMTKLDIAEQCGFNSSSNFYKAFGKITGKTPSQFAKSLTQNKKEQ